jgi:NADH-quinone oxidoreductase subunit G
VLRVLGNLLGLDGFSQETAEDVRAEALGDLAVLSARLDNGSTAALALAATAPGLQRVADVPIYSTDALVRRAPSLQRSADAREPVAGLTPALWVQLGLRDGDRVRVTQGQGSAVLDARADATLAEGTVRVAAGHASTARLGAMFGTLTVQKA